MKITLRSLISDQKVREIVSEAIESSVQSIMDLELQIGEPTGNPVVLTKDTLLPTAKTDFVEQSKDAELFPCDLCDKAYPTKQGLGGHRYNTHGYTRNGPSVVCSICDGRYRDYRGLSSHVRAKHSVLYEDWLEETQGQFGRKTTRRQHA